MAGFFAKKMSREHRKLIKQNELALDWLEQLGSTATALGISEEDRELLMVIENYRIVVDEARIQLEMTPILPKETVSINFDINRKLRRIYDDTRRAQKQFKKQFGTLGTQKLEKFDKQFEPSEGWKIFFATK